MIAVIDNYDSFTYNLVQYMGEIRSDIEVFRNDRITVADLLAKNPERIIVSPGPCTPKEAGISVELIQNTPPGVPLLGVCLGHQSLGAAFGGHVIKAPYLMHGKVSKVTHRGEGILQGVESPFSATRYHSLIVERKSLPPVLKITAETEDGLIMAMQHVEKPLFGLQFHPESIMTGPGKIIVKNFLTWQEGQ